MGPLNYILLAISWTILPGVPWTFGTDRVLLDLELPVYNIPNQAIPTDTDKLKSFHRHNHANQDVPLSNLYDKMMKAAMFKALTNRDFRQKFNSVMPVLRDLTQEQILTLSKLVSIQLNSKTNQDNELRKVMTHFRGKKSLALSWLSDFAALFGNSAQSLNGLETAVSTRRNFQLTPEEVKKEGRSLNIEEHIMEPRLINEQLMDFGRTTEVLKNHRSKRSIKLAHKLLRVPHNLNTTEDGSNLNETAEMKLNTSSFVGPYQEYESQVKENLTELSYDQIEDLAFADLNGTEIELKINATENEHLPVPEELVAGPRYRLIPRPYYTPINAPARKRIPLRTAPLPLPERKCERFTASMCITTSDYPMDQIMGSIRRHKHAMNALLAEYHDRAAELEYQEQLEEYRFNNKRREDNVVTPGGMCSSIVKYARPQKARSALGEWKYIVNTGRHTQTLRLEKCSTPQESCSYLSHNYRSRCTQVYNYHRLLSWDKDRGLHVDIFKVPTCCSCQIDGYRETFPPLEASKYKDYSLISNNNPYGGNEEIDYEEEEENEEIPVSYPINSDYKKRMHDSYQPSELFLPSKQVKSRVIPPTVGSYLSPPSDNYEIKTPRPSHYTNSVIGGNFRKLHKSFIPSEARVDLEISGTEQSNKEVKPFSRTHQKRTRVFTSPVTVETPYESSVVPSASMPTFESTTALTNSNVFTSTNLRKDNSNGKRINYSYHPIIDFFESPQKTPGKAHVRPRQTSNSIPVSVEVITARDRRISFGQNNNWHPLVGS